LIAALASGVLVAQQQTASAEFKRLHEAARAARLSGDKGARLRALLELQNLQNNAPNVVGAVARAYAEAEDTKNALAALEYFAELGQSDEGLLEGNDKAFAAIVKLPEFQAIRERLERNKAPIARAETALTLADPGLVAEDIDYDPQSKSFLITSVLERKIIRVSADAMAKDFAASPSGWPMLAIKLDTTRNLVWATEVALDGFRAAPKADWGRSAVLCFALKSGELRRRIEGPKGSALGDMTLDREGNPIVSDGNGGVYRVKGEGLERIDHGDFISPQTPALHPDGKHAFVPDYARGVGILDLASGHVSWMGGKHALSTIDGLYFDQGALIATQNGTSPERVIRFRLDSRLAGIDSEEIIERATATLGDPTHGVVVGDYFYYIANSGWSELEDNGELKAGSKLTPARIMRFRLRGADQSKKPN
jgi:sugar lactone lactonase YvrE